MRNEIRKSGREGEGERRGEREGRIDRRDGEIRNGMERGGRQYA